MRKFLLSTAMIMMMGGQAFAAPVIGEAAPEWTGIDSHGVQHSLSDFKGKTVVMEWTNNGCPYVRKHYDSGNMQALQKEATDKGIVWITVASSAEGKQGHLTPEETNDLMAKEGSNATARILDPEGTIGHAYEAKTTPHMYVINPDGVLVYNGAIDDDPSFKTDGIKTAKNYVKAAWKAVAAGDSIETAATQPYGCSVKY